MKLTEIGERPFLVRDKPIEFTHLVDRRLTRITCGPYLLGELADLTLVTVGSGEIILDWATVPNLITTGQPCPRDRLLR